MLHRLKLFVPLEHINDGNKCTINLLLFIVSNHYKRHHNYEDLTNFNGNSFND